MERMRIVILSLALMMSTVTFGQMGISLGYSAFKGFSAYKAHHGISIGLELPRDDAMTLYGRFTHYFRNLYPEDTLQYFLEPRDPNAPFVLSSTSSIPGMNANVIEGGTRYYIGDGYDNGFAAYGGSALMIIMNKITYEVGPYNQVDYVPYSPYNYVEGSIFSLGFGLEGGAKYSMPPYGTIYADIGFSYIIFNTVSVPANVLFYVSPYRQLYFSFNIGFRKDLLW